MQNSSKPNSPNRNSNTKEDSPASDIRPGQALESVAQKQAAALLNSSSCLALFREQNKETRLDTLRLPELQLTDLETESFRQLLKQAQKETSQSPIPDVLK